LTGSATNNGATRFPTIVNGSFSAGTFTNLADGDGNIWLKFVPANAYIRPTIDPEIVGAGQSNATISWSGIEGQTYQLHYKDDLNASNWGVLGTIIAPTGVISFVDTNAPSTRRFYRVIIP
jgi:hypothetical protein